MGRPWFMSWHAIAPRLCNGMAAHSRKVLVGWLIMLACTAPFAVELFSHTVITFDAPANSVSGQAKEMTSHYFPDLAAQGSSAIVYVESSIDRLNETTALKTITDRLVAKFAHPSDLVPFGCNISGYETYKADNCTEIATSYLSPSMLASIIRLTPPQDVILSKLGSPLLKFVDELKKDSEFSNLWIGSTGDPVILSEMVIGAVKDAERADSISVPTAFLVLAFMISSWRLLLITVINLVTVLCLSFAALDIIAINGVQVMITTPTIMSFITLALSIDYSLFMLTRLSDELKKETPFHDAVEACLTSPGHTVLGSGSTLMLCFAVLCFYPLAIMSSCGLGVTMSMFFAITINLVLTPALLFSFPTFFSKLGFGLPCCSRRENKATAPTPVAPTPVISELAAPPKTYTMARSTTRCASTLVAVALVVIAIVLTVPVLMKLKTDGNMEALIPSNSVSMDTFDKVVHTFPLGIASPYNVLLIPEAAWDDTSARGAIFTESFWVQSSYALANLSALLPNDTLQILSPMFIQGGISGAQDLLAQIPIALQVEVLHKCHESFDPKVNATGTLPNPGPCVPGRGCCFNTFNSTVTRGLLQLELKRPVTDSDVYLVVGNLRGALEMTTNSQGSAINAQMIANLAMGDQTSCDFVAKARDVLDGDFVGVRARMTGGSTDIADVNSILQRMNLPICGAVTCLVLIVIALLYKSIMIPLRALITIGVTELFAFAVVICIYQRDGPSSIGAPFAALGSIDFMSPPMIFCVVLGLSLDYDVFLLGRVVEFRRAGFGDRDSIELGLFKTGKIITAAGLIMAITFSGMLLSKISTLNVVGTAMVSAVLLDTFVMRSMVTPAIMAPLGSLNWFPSKMPLPYRDALEYVKSDGRELIKSASSQGGVSLLAAGVPAQP